MLKKLTLVEERVNSVIKIGFFSTGLSVIGRVLVVNSLCASKWCYIISVLQPPQKYISSLQKAFIDFVWQGRHWAKSDILYLRKSLGGLGLVHILSILHAFRLRFIHEYLYYDRHICYRIANVFFRRVYNFGYSKQLFLLMPVKYDVSNIPPFYQSLINTWSLFSHKKSDTTLPNRWYTIFEPLWYNSYVTHNRNIITDTVIQQFISLGITQVKHLCEMKSYEPQFRSKRIFED